MPTLSVVRRERSAAKISAAGSGQIELIVAAVLAKVKGHLDKGVKLEEVAAAVRLVITLLIKVLGHNTEMMVAADKSVIDCLHGDAAPRNARDAAVIKLNDLLVRTRSSLSGAFGASAIEHLEFGDRATTEPALLTRTAADVAAAIRATAWGEPTDGVTVDTKLVAQRIDTLLEEVKKHAVVVESHTRSTQTSRSARDTATGSLLSRDR